MPDSPATTTLNQRLPDAAAMPLVSVLMPVRNEARHIESSLRSVLAQDYPRDRLEIIVADGMSTDGTRKIVESLQSENGNIRLIDNPGKIVPTGMNAALRLAQGDVMVRVDGHCEPAPDYVRRCVEHLAASRVAGVGGPIETVGETYTARAIAVAMSSLFGVGGSAFRTVKDRAMFVETVPFPAYDRETIRTVGFYDEEFVRNQDDEYNYRIRDLGGRLLLSPDIRSRYFSRTSVRSLWRQYFRYGFWKVRVMQKHPRQMRWRQYAPPLLVACLLVCIILAVTVAVLPLIGISAAYSSVLLIGAIITAGRSRWRYLPLLPVVFAVLHLSYGFGFLAGLVVFWRRWNDTTGRVPDCRLAEAKEIG